MLTVKAQAAAAATAETRSAYSGYRDMAGNVCRILPSVWPFRDASPASCLLRTSLGALNYLAYLFICARIYPSSYWIFSGGAAEKAKGNVVKSSAASTSTFHVLAFAQCRYLSVKLILLYCTWVPLVS